MPLDDEEFLFIVQNDRRFFAGNRRRLHVRCIVPVLRMLSLVVPDSQLNPRGIIYHSRREFSNGIRREGYKNGKDCKSEYAE